MGGERGGNGGCRGRGNCNQDNTYKKSIFNKRKKEKDHFPLLMVRVITLPCIFVFS